GDNRVTAVVSHSPDIPQHVVADNVFGADDGIHAHGFEGVELVDSVHFGNGFGDADLFAEKGNDQIDFVDICQGDEGVGFSGTLRIHQLLVTGVSVNHQCFGQQLRQFHTPVIVPLDDLHLNAGTGQLFRQIVAQTAAAHNDHLANPVGGQIQIAHQRRQIAV